MEMEIGDDNNNKNTNNNNMRRLLEYLLFNKWPIFVYVSLAILCGLVVPRGRHIERFLVLCHRNICFYSLNIQNNIYTLIRFRIRKNVIR